MHHPEFSSFRGVLRNVVYIDLSAKKCYRWTVIYRPCLLSNHDRNWLLSINEIKSTLEKCFFLASCSINRLYSTRMKKFSFLLPMDTFNATDCINSILVSWDRLARWCTTPGNNALIKSAGILFETNKSCDQTTFICSVRVRPQNQHGGKQHLRFSLFYVSVKAANRDAPVMFLDRCLL